MKSSSLVEEAVKAEILEHLLNVFGPVCEIRDVTHDEWEISCSLTATHIGRPTCEPAKTKLICTEVAKLIANGTIHCEGHDTISHMVAVPL